nr:magnesium dependent phosphatase 1 [Hymenolepis microstoma]
MVFADLSRKPKLIVFDLDFTLWPFDCIDYTHSHLTIRDDKVYDSFNHVVEPFPESGAVLQIIKEELNTKIGVASSTAAPRMGRKFINLFGWEKYFDYVEIYPTDKTRHFRKLENDSGISFQDMLFFDDLGFNIRDVSSLGVHCVHVNEDGVDLALLRSGLESFARASF